MRSKLYLLYIFQYWLNFESNNDFGPPKSKVLVISPTILYLLFEKNHNYSIFVFINCIYTYNTYFKVNNKKFTAIKEEKLNWKLICQKKFRI
jgi:hypothetical protein